MYQKRWLQKGLVLLRVRLQMADEKNFAVEFYFAMKQAVTGRVSKDQKRITEKKKIRSKPFDSGRDPISASNSIDSLMEDFRWQSQMEEAELFVRWSEIVGDLNAKNTHPENLANGKLTVRCKSTAWATELRLMQNQILDKIGLSFPELEIKSISFIGPDAPSWKKGPRSVPGRGPRDTYG
jgi:predicted nucleic acid-binding Zn ribbon protein